MEMMDLRHCDRGRLAHVKVWCLRRDCIVWIALMTSLQRRTAH